MDLDSLKLAMKQIALEKGLSEEDIIETLNSALAAAYRKDFGHKNQNIIFEFDPDTGAMKVVDKKVVVDFPPEIIAEIDELGRDKKFVKGGEEEEGEEGTEKAPSKDYGKEDEVSEDDEDVIRFNPKTDILLDDAKKLKKSAKVGDEIITELQIPDEFGRMAAQTAKQVIIQKIREAERVGIYNEYKDKEGELVIGTVQRREGGVILIDLGKATGVMPYEEQMRNERYNPGERMKFYIAAVNETMRGPEIVLSRGHINMIKKLFEVEIPEVASGVIEIKAISREAGFRSKVAVYTEQENIDPIGSCIGQRGSRIQTIITELNGEKIDIIEWSDDPAQFVSNALAPAKIVGIELDDAEKEAGVTVAEDQLSLAIGKEGQNVRLAAKLTGWKINILKETAEGAVEEVALSKDAVSDAEEASAGASTEKDEEGGDEAAEDEGGEKDGEEAKEEESKKD